MKSQIQTTDLQCEFQRLVEFFGKDWWLEHQSNGVKNYISLQGWIAPPTFISPLHVTLLCENNIVIDGTQNW